MARFACTMVSYVLDRAVDLTVIVPTPTYPDICAAKEKGASVTHTPASPYPLLYLLHGYSGNHSSWTAYANTEMFAEERKIAVVMLSAENKAYVDMGSDRFFEFLSSELPDFVTGLFPVSKRPQDTYIAGLSMGGYGALIHGLRCAGRFAALGSFSGAVLGSSRLAGAECEKFDTRRAARDLLQTKSAFPAMYLACGEKDFLYEDNRAFADFLRENGQTFTWVTHPDYGHEWRFWNEQIEAFLDWLPRTDPYRNIRTAV